MEPNQVTRQDVSIERVRHTLVKHLAAERATLLSLIDAQLTHMHQCLFSEMEANFSEDLPASLPPSACELDSAPQNSKSEDDSHAPDEAGNKVGSKDINIMPTDCNNKDDSLPIGPDGVQVSLPTRQVSPKVTSRFSDRMKSHHEATNFLRRLAEHPAFEGFFIGAILLNTLVIALYAQYRSFDIGARIKYPLVRYGPDTWSYGKDAFEALEYFFAAVYTIELVVKAAALRCDFWKSSWHVFDFTLVSFWYVRELTSLAKDFNPTMLRLCRLARLMRVIRHVDWFQSLDTLHMLITAMAESVSVLVWSVLLLVGCFGLSALVTNALMVAYMQDPTEDPAAQREVYKYFGSFSRSFISMFEMAFHNHAPIMRQIMEKVDEGWAVYFLLWKCIGGLWVMRVVMGVFMHETFKVCSENDELMIAQKKRAQLTHKKKMEKLFRALNEDGSETIEWSEFRDVMKDSWVRTWLHAQGLPTDNAAHLWSLLDTSGDGELTAEELVKGVGKLKGAATSMDMNQAVLALEGLKSQIQVMNDALITFDEKILRGEERILQQLPSALAQGNDTTAQPKSLSNSSGRRSFGV